MQLNRIFLIGFAAAAVVLGFVIWGGLESTKGNHLVPTGKIGRTRVQKIDDTMVAVVLDFHVRNDSDRDMIVRSSLAQVEMADGSKVDGINSSAADAPKLFLAYPLLGEQFNPVLKERDTIAPHQEVDRMIVSRFDIALADMEKRKKITLTIEDITGPTLSMETK